MLYFLPATSLSQIDPITLVNAMNRFAGGMSLVNYSATKSEDHSQGSCRLKVMIVKHLSIPLVSFFATVGEFLQTK